jgi:hypothetical protein
MSHKENMKKLLKFIKKSYGRQVRIKSRECNPGIGDFVEFRREVDHAIKRGLCRKRSMTVK